MKQLLALAIFYFCIFIGFYYFIPKSNNEELIVNVSNNSVDMNSYVERVVASEMPASFELEALKAQCVAVRSFAIARNLNVDTTTNTQVYKSEQELKDLWKDDYQYYINRIKQAVKETQNEVLYYENEVISAFYFAASNGYTSKSNEYFSNDLPYIQSVSSSLELENYSKAITTTSFIQKELKQVFNSLVDVSIKILSRYDTNRVKEVSVNDKIYTGKEFREMLGLRSSDFQIKKITDGYEITTIGYGHGIGMSQYGANGLAKKGYNYKEILEYYYKDVEIKPYIK